MLFHGIILIPTLANVFSEIFNFSLVKLDQFVDDIFCIKCPKLLQYILHLKKNHIIIKFFKVMKLKLQHFKYL